MRRKSQATEIIRVEIHSNEGGVVVGRDVVTRQTIRLEPHDGLVVGATSTVELARSGMLAAVVRILDLPSGPTRQNAPSAKGSEAPVLVNGRPFKPSPDPIDLRLAAGDVRTAYIGFTGRRTGERDRGRSGKRRPVVVMTVDEHSQTAEVCPVHGANSVVRATGGGRRLVGWHALGLRKSSVVAAQRVVVPIERIGDLIGRLGPDDRCRLGMTP